MAALTTLAGSLAGGIAGGNAASALAGGQGAKNEVENNYLAAWQKDQYRRELDACKSSLTCQARVHGKYLSINVSQDARLVSGMALGAMLELNDLVKALPEIPGVVNAILNNPSILKNLPAGYAAQLESTYSAYLQALEHAGPDGATAAGVEFVKLANLVAPVVSSAGGVLKVGEQTVATLGKVTATTWEASKVLNAGEVLASSKGFISAQQITRQGVPATLTAAEQAQLTRLGQMDSASAGALREAVADAYFRRNGFTALDGKCGAHCFDGVYIKGDQVIINEVKPLGGNNTIKLSDNAESSADIGVQMSDKWISSRISVLMESKDPLQVAVAQKINIAMKQGNLVKLISGVGESGLVMVKVVIK